MRRVWWIWMFFFTPLVTSGQKQWDGGAGTPFWNDSLNWLPNGVPSGTDTVLINNSYQHGDFEVRLPAGNTGFQVMQLQIIPSTGNKITVEIPVNSTAVPALSALSTGDGLLIEKGGEFILASGATSGNPLQLLGKLCIRDGGKFIHRTPRGNADLTGRLSTAVGTEKGIFEFDVPGTAGYTISLTGKVFGTLYFSSSAAGGSKTYQAGGSSVITIRGDLVIKEGTRLNSTLTADILLKGDLQTDGQWTLAPATAGLTGRSLVITGKNASWSGKGSAEFHPFFRQLLIDTSALLLLNDTIRLPGDSIKTRVRGSLHLMENAVITGSGSFHLEDLGQLFLENRKGINLSGDSGAVQTGTRQFSKKARYGLIGANPQVGGTGLPDTILSLHIHNRNGVALSQSLTISDSLIIQNGLLFTDTNRLIYADAARIRSVDSGYIAGPVRLRSTGTERFLIPVGDSLEYAPIFFRNARSEDLLDIGIRYQGEKRNSASYWTISNPSPGALYVALASNKRDSLNSILQKEIWVGRSGQWQFTPTREVRQQNFTLLETTDPVSESASLSIRQQQPVLLWQGTPSVAGIVADHVLQLDIKVTPPDKWVRIEWGRQTNQMLKLDSFAVDRQQIRWKNTAPAADKFFIRLATGDQAGNIRFSPTIAIKKSSREDGKIFPNPANEKILIFFSDSCSNRSICIVHMSGARIRSLRLTDNKLNISDLAPGAYVLQLTGCGRNIILPFTKY